MPGGLDLARIQRLEQLRTAQDYITRGWYQSAADLCNDLLRRRAADPDALTLLAAAMLRLGRYDEVRRACERGLRARPADPALLFHLAMAHIRESRFAEAHRALDRALARRPGDPELVGAKVDALVTAGDYDEAWRVGAAAWRDDDPNPTLAIALGRAAAQTGHAPEAVAFLERTRDAIDRWPGARPDVLYALGEARDAAGLYDRAFEAFEEANRLCAGAHDPDAQSEAIDAMIDAWSPATIARLPRASRPSPVLFIVGMWRSGTTLVEQILSSHPAVAGAGESMAIPRWVHEHGEKRPGTSDALILDPTALSAVELDRLAGAYRGEMARLSAKAALYTDKMHTNFLHLGLIDRAFPGSRIVYCVRDPVDTCVSCFFNVRGDVGYAHDLRACGRFYRDSERLMAHWRAVLGAPVLDVRYEELVSDQEAVTRRLVEFAGLPWDEACLRPHENRRTAQTRSIDQVRRPVYRTSIGRAANYAAHLGPLHRGLEEGLARARRA